MISRRAQENIVAVLLLGFFLVVLYTSLGFSPRARLVPVPISALAILLLLFQIFWQNYRPAEELNVDLLDVLTGRSNNPETAPEIKAKPADIQEQKVKESEDWRRILISLGFVAILVALVLLAGPIPAIFVFTFGYFIVSGHLKPLKAAIYTLTFTVAIYLIFFVVLKIQLYHGYLEPVAEFLRRL